MALAGAVALMLATPCEAQRKGYRKGNHTNNYADGSSYTGEWKDFLFHGQGTYHYADGAQDPPTTYTTFANGVTTFALSAFRARSQAEKGSFVFSTASSFLQLNLLANAASADTRLEILQALAGNLTLDDCNACSSYFKSRIESVSKIGQKEAPDAQARPRNLPPWLRALGGDY